MFNDYAKQLMRRYPGMKEEINIRLQHLNGQWESLEKTVSPGSLHRDEKTMLRGQSQSLLIDRLITSLITKARPLIISETHSAANT